MSNKKYSRVVELYNEPKELNLPMKILYILCLPFIALYFIGFIICDKISAPIKRKKVRNSRYEIDFPSGDKTSTELHDDNEIYTIVKKNNLPIEYLKWCHIYDVKGYFAYKDILLDFDTPIWFSEKKGCLCSDSIFLNMSDDFVHYELMDGIWDDNGIYIGKDLTLDEVTERILAHYNSKSPKQECKRVVFFYCVDNDSKKRKETDEYKKTIEKKQQNDCLVLYKKGKLTEAIKNFVENN